MYMILKYMVNDTKYRWCLMPLVACKDNKFCTERQPSGSDIFKLTNMHITSS